VEVLGRAVEQRVTLDQRDPAAPVLLAQDLLLIGPPGMNQRSAQATAGATLQRFEPHLCRLPTYADRKLGPRDPMLRKRKRVEADLLEPGLAHPIGEVVSGGATGGAAGALLAEVGQVGQGA